MLSPRIPASMVARLLLASAFLLAAPPLARSSSPSSASPSTHPSLPLSKVVLYSSGVGYFQHDGKVHDRVQLDLRFNVNQVNDLLKSLVVQDFSGGQVAFVTYGSRDPVAKTLTSFGINLTGNPTLSQLLTQVRGEQVELATPNPVIGTLVGVEQKTEVVGDGPQHRLVETEYVTLLTEEGFRSIPLLQVQRLRLVNEPLNRELQQALMVLATSHDTQKRTVSITFDGKGSREARVSYLTETPVWKSSYRLVLDEEGPPFLQGWAIVENTTESDWSNVRLSLVSGRPISFMMDLYQPLYAPRPLIEPELYASLRPQVYGEALERAPVVEGRLETGIKEAKMKGERWESDLTKTAARTRPFAQSPAADMPRADEAFRSLQEGVVTAAAGRDAGELFEYRLATPVSLAKHSSALLPILGQGVQGQKLSIYNQSVNAKHPLNGFRLKNTTSLYLMQGPITMFDGGAYAGDARIEDLAPGQDRLISYALDLRTEVEPKTESGQQELVTVKLRKGTMLVTRRLIDERTYTITNRDQKSKTVLIEHPYRADWKLAEPGEPSERTREVYRFPLTVEPGKRATLRVKETKPLQEMVLLLDAGFDQIGVYLQAKEVNPKVKDALQRVVSLRSKRDETRSQRTRLEQRIAEITAEHGRIRENMRELAQTSELYARYVRKLDQQETELEKLRKEVDTRKNAEEEQRRELEKFLLELELV
jgi:hypothetical protein